MNANAARRVDEAAQSEFGRDFIRCLSQLPHTISPKHFYDAAGSRLFDRICALPEYYPTRTEIGILQRHAGDIAAAIGPEAEIVEFGAGSLVKIRLLLDALDSPRRFVAVDISGEHLAASIHTLRDAYPRLDLVPVVADFSRPEWLPLWRGGRQRRVGFFPGSTIGNFSPAEAQRFLSSAARLLKGGGLLIGVDLVKDPRILHAAYNDAAGITAAFNLNLLERANSDLGADFGIDRFRHYAFYNATMQRIEMHLIAAGRQQVRLGGRLFTLREGESLHTENSHKYTVESFQALAANCGFQPTACWCDDDRLFSVHWLIC